MSSESDSPRIDEATTRRRFLTSIGAAAVGLGASTVFASSAMGAAGRASSFALRPPTFPDIPGRNINEQTLNFALTLEILEADL
jgi:hypothetical protein